MFWDASFLPSTAALTRTCVIFDARWARSKMAATGSKEFAEPATFMPGRPGRGAGEEAVPDHFAVVLAHASGRRPDSCPGLRALGICIPIGSAPDPARPFDIPGSRRHC